jgi:phage/plasmid-associated DNA primase
VTEIRNDWGCTDVGNKDRFVKKYQGTLKYVTEEKAWYTHDGTRWKQNAAKVYSKAERVAKDIYREAVDGCAEGRLSGVERCRQWLRRS